jgi:hypothetical protein
MFGYVWNRPKRTPVAIIDRYITFLDRQSEFILQVVLITSHMQQFLMLGTTGYVYSRQDVKELRKKAIYLRVPFIA